MTLLKLDFDTRDTLPGCATFFRREKVYAAVLFLLRATGWHLIGEPRRRGPLVQVAMGRVGPSGWMRRAVRITPSRHGWHVVIRVRERLDPVTVVAAQACLGSDVKRETFNLARALQKAPAFWRRRANVLYSRKVK